MISPFLREFSTFVQAVDFINDDGFDRARSALAAYFRTRFSADFWELLQPVKSPSGSVSLLMEWSSGSELTTTEVEIDGVLSGQTAYCYSTGRPVWITAQGGGLLSAAQGWIDHISGDRDLPAYRKFGGNPEPTKTSVIMPVKAGGKRYVLNLESKEDLRYVDALKPELQLLAASIGDFVAKHEQSNRTEKGTLEVASALSPAAQREQLIGPTRVFFAYPDRACGSVLGDLREVLNSFSAEIELIDWRALSGSGDVRQQIFDALESASIGVCYFSEPADAARSGPVYVDNPNVLFEAGYLQSRSRQPAAQKVAWVPVREEDSPPAPFDFSNDRRIIVPRNDDGTINSERFCTKFRDQFARALEHVRSVSSG